MTPSEFRTFSSALSNAPQPKADAAAATVSKLEQPSATPLREPVVIPAPAPAVPTAPPAPVCETVKPQAPAEEPEQIRLDMPQVPQWRLVGELYRSYIIVEEGDNAFLIDKHAAHERILFDKLKSNQEVISSQHLLSPVPVRLSPEAAAELLSNRELLTELGFEIDEFGDNTVLLRQVPMDLSPDGAAEALETIASDLLNGRRESRNTVRDEILHTVACKAAIKAGWHSDERELLALVREVMAREDLKYCPHGRPICITLSKKQLEKQFKRS
jgi:DNA mismatch repair protein MutL